MCMCAVPELWVPQLKYLLLLRFGDLLTLPLRPHALAARPTRLSERFPKLLQSPLLAFSRDSVNRAVGPPGACPPATESSPRARRAPARPPARPGALCRARADAHTCSCSSPRPILALHAPCSPHRAHPPPSARLCTPLRPRAAVASPPCRAVRFLSGRAARARVCQVLFALARLPQPAAFARIGHNAVARVAGLGVVEVLRWRTSFYFNCAASIFLSKSNCRT